MARLDINEMQTVQRKERKNSFKRKGLKLEVNTSVQSVVIKELLGSLVGITEIYRKTCASCFRSKTFVSLLPLVNTRKDPAAATDSFI
jgi:hypothetical protein